MNRLDATAPALTIDEVSGERRALVSGDWSSLAVAGQDMARQLSGEQQPAAWDLSQVDALDHNAAMLLWRTWGGRLPERIELKNEHRAIFDRIAQVPGPAAAPPGFRLADPLVAIGARGLGFLSHLRATIELTGSVVLDVWRMIGERSRWPFREISASIYRVGAQALGITGLVGFLIGVVLSYLAAQQLRNFGADVYIVDLLGISVLRELGPVLAAILVAGRSGSSITAQLGVMRLNEEVDALTVMGVATGQRLILPKIVALAIAQPLLALWTNTLALIGGMVAANVSLGLSYRYFITALPAAVPIENYWIGLGKSVVFGALIALIACHYGLRIKPNTQSLGAGTTSSVVASITAVIVADALFAVLFQELGL